MKGFHGRVCAAVLTLFALLAFLAAPAFAAGKEGDESMELRASLAAFLGPRSAPAATVNPLAFTSAAASSLDMPPINGATWQELGPYHYNPDAYPQYLNPDSNVGSGGGNNTGRITGVAVAPDGSVYVAGAGGGIWRSDDGGSTWTPLFDDQATTAEGTVAVVPDDSPSGYTVYAGTGEPTINLDSYAGVGILASSDRGASWHVIGGDGLAGAAVYKIVPDGSALLAATSYGLYRLDSPDGTWTRVIGSDANSSGDNRQVLNLVSDVAVTPHTNGQEVVALRGWRAGAATNGLYVSRDGGHTFTGPLQPQGYVPQNAQGRATLAYSSDGKKLYVMVEDPVSFAHGGGGTELEGIYLSTHDVSGPFNQIASPSVLMNSGSAQKPGSIGPGYKPGVQAWYNQFLIVDPSDSSHLYAGLEEIYETTNAGKSWVTAAPYWNLTLK
ncbi:MAG TPA: hypothetical protein VFT42_04035 [Solirubrobacteraceae bacterium]|nr:hypothetical protein [Solirubrobacteraceae bacterium]